MLNLIRQYPELYQPKSNLKRISNRLSLLIERSLDPLHTNEPNDPLAIKAHYIKKLIDEIFNKSTDDVEKTCNDLSEEWEEILFDSSFTKIAFNRFAHGNENDGFKMFEEKFLRETIRNFPYKQCPLLKQLVRLIAPITIVKFIIWFR